MIARVAVLAILCLAAAAHPAVADERAPELLLSWNAPYGQNGASSALRRACGDSAAVDTLYLSYRLPRDVEVLSGITGILMFHAQLDDSMTSRWRTDSQKPSFLKVDFPHDSSQAFRSGFASAGFGDWRYYAESNRGIVRLIYAIPAMVAGPVRAGTYCLARVIVQRGSGPACREAQCVEWFESRVAFSVNAPDVSGTQVRDSFATINSPTGIACAKYRLLSERRVAEQKQKEAGESD